MKKNDDIEVIAKKLAEAESVLIFPHIVMDGDALGSGAALCEALRNSGKTAHILIEDKIPDNLAFLDRGFCTTDVDVIKDPDVCICIDCGDTGRFPKRAEKFMTGKTLICVDHHATSEPFCDYNHIEPGSAATAELIYLLLRAADAEITKEIAESIFAGITTDTGDFQYSNTTKRTHEIVSALYDCGMDFSKVSIELYENENPKKMKLQNMIVGSTEFFADGQLAMACVTQKMLKECECTMEESEGTVSMLRSVRGVQIAIILKENAKKSIKATLRSKSVGDVSAIAVKHGGGGHVRAAGCTINDTLEQAKEAIREDALEELGYK